MTAAAPLLRRFAIPYWIVAAAAAATLSACATEAPVANRAPEDSLTASPRLAAAFLPQTRSIATSEFSTCAIDTNQDAWCWGDNKEGEVGKGNFGGSAPNKWPTRVVGGHKFSSIAASSVGGGFCALTPAGDVWCWGMAGASNLEQHTGWPVHVSVPRPIVRITVAGGGWCGLASSGQVYCSSVDGLVMGNGAALDSATPPRVATLAAGGMRFTDIAAGYGFVCGIRTSGGAYCWGSNRYHQLGDTATDESCDGFPCRTRPTPVYRGSAFVRIAAGSQHACALTTSGAAYCWGHNWFGNVGVGTPPDIGDVRATPVAVSGGRHFTNIAASYTTTCGTVAGGALYCWGDSFLPAPYSAVPVAIAGLPSVNAFALSDGHACASSAFRHQLYCWGYDAWGELGTGHVNTPLIVHWFPARVSLAVQVP